MRGLVRMIDENWQIVGILVSFMAFFTTIFLAFYIRYLDGKQRKRDENFYVTATMKDIQQLKTHLINIQEISECENIIPSMEEQTEVTQKLVNYAEKNKKLMELLISDTRFSMSKWMSLKDVEKTNVENFIETANWVLDYYLPKSDESIHTQKRRLLNYLKEFQERKNKSSEKIDELISKYS